MKNLLAKLLVLPLLLSLPLQAWSAEFALVQSAAPTSATTQDFTSSGFGTPLCALFWASYGTANNTAATHTMFAIGGTDGTRSFSFAAAAEGAGQDISDSGGESDVDAALLTLLVTDQTQDAEADFSAMITDGIRLNWPDAPPAAYLINALLVGGSVTNCRVDSFMTPAVQDTATDVNTVGFQPDIVITWGSGIGTSGMTPTVGITVNDGSNTAYAMGQAVANGAPTMAVSGKLFSQRAAGSSQAANPTTVQIQDFDSSGFSAFSRDGGTARTVRYLAVKLAAGMGKALLSCDTPTGTGAHSCTGAGWTPQFGLQLLGEWAALDVEYTTDNSETTALGAFTASTSLVAGTYSEDSDGTSTEFSMTNTIPIHLYKDSADYMKATSTGPTSDGWEFNFSVAPAVAKKRAILFVQAASSGNTATRRRNFP